MRIGGMGRACTWLGVALPMISLLAVRAEGACVPVENEDLIEYSCEGGSIEDLSTVPTKVEKIRISNMPVRRIGASLFSRFGANLVALSCSHCLIEDIDDNAFRSLENLQQLSLDNNHLKEVKGVWFEGLIYLTFLDLNYNAIERIDGDVFRNARDLVDLRISGNQLLCLDIESMSNLKNLKRIFINENPNFGCPNAVKKFLKDRQVEFEVDPKWNSMSQDRISAVAPLPATRAPTTTEQPRTRWTEPTTTPPAPPTMPPVPPTPRRPYIPEMIQPAVPDPDFPYQGPYYAPRPPPQAQPQPEPLDNYRTTARQPENQPRNNETSSPKPIATNSTSPRVLVAGQEAPTTECPNSATASAVFSRSVFIVLAAILLAHR